MLTISVSQKIRELRSHNTGSAAHMLAALKRPIIAHWETWAREVVLSAKNKDSLVLIDKLDRFIDELVHALNPRINQYDATEGNDFSKHHGQHRASTPGYSLAQMLQEYSLLKKTILVFLHEKQALSLSEREIIDDSFDKSMQQAAQEFAEVQQSKYKVALEEAQNSNSDLEDFAAIAAHDLKAPLNTVTSYLNLIHEEIAESSLPETRELFQFVLAANDRMRDLVDRLLGYASLKAATPDFSEVKLNDVCNATCDNLKVLIEKKKAIVNRDDLPCVRGDVTLLIQLFQNLVTNALKFNTNPQPEIFISASAVEPSFVVVTVKDNGLGFDSSKTEEIFSPYMRLHETSGHPGAGLGLATCKRVVDLHGGQIWAESTIGEGSLFSIKLPRPKV